MDLIPSTKRFVLVVGSGGVGKTTLAAATGLLAARDGRDTLVMTFDPSLRLKDSLGVGDEARGSEVPVETGNRGRLWASLLDARKTFDGLVERYAPSDAARKRILDNRFYRHLAGNLAGILEYMAVERLYEVASDDRFSTVVLDTPPTRQALDFLEAPQRIVSFLDSGALRIALRSWFDDNGRFLPSARMRSLGRTVESFLDRIVGLELLRDMAEFFQAFGPLFEGFRDRALKVRDLLRSPETVFLLVAGPGEKRVADTMFFARKLREAGYELGRVIVNRVHPPADSGDPLMRWLGERDGRGLGHLRELLPEGSVIALPMLRREPTDLAALAGIGDRLAGGAGTLST